jgi:ribonuclease HII
MIVAGAACIEGAPLLCGDSKSYGKNFFRLLGAATRDKEHLIAYCCEECSPTDFDSRGHTVCREATFRLVFDKLLREVVAYFGAETPEFQCIIDGALTFGLSDPRVALRAVPKADAKFPVVGAASCIAKVAQIEAMQRQHEKTPEYCFDKHHGYGTELHVSMIDMHGAIRGFHRIRMLEALWRDKYKKPLPMREK